MDRPQTDFPAELWRAFAHRRAPVRCSAGHMIYLQGSLATCFYYLKRGRVKSLIQSEDGGERVLRIYQEGAIFGEASFFDELPRVSSAVAMTFCEVVPIDRELVAQEFARDPGLAMSMIRYLARAVRLLSGQVDDMAFRPAAQRLAGYLLGLCQGDGRVPCTQEEIAAAISASRVTVSRALSELSERGWVTTGYGSVRVVDRAALEEFSR